MTEIAVFISKYGSIIVAFFVMLIVLIVGRSYMNNRFPRLPLIIGVGLITFCVIYAETHGNN